MTDPSRPRSESRRARRRLVRHALLRPTLTAAALFTLYFTLPMDTDFHAETVIILVLGLGAVGCLVVFQVRAIIRSKTPRITAATSVAATVPLFVLAFATAYFLMADSTNDAFTQPLTRLDALYFATAVLTTVGFGDIAAVSEVARIVTTVQMFADLLLLGLVVRVLFGAVGYGRGGPTDPATSAAGPPDLTTED